MSKYYTNCQVSGNKILLREIDNGIRKKYKVDYNPTLFARSKTKSKYKTLHGEFLEPLKIGDIRETQKFVAQNRGIPNFELFGNTQFEYSFIADEYSQSEIEFKIKDLVILNLDLEMESEENFPEPETALERINVITAKVFGQKEFHVFTFTDGKTYNDSNKYTSPNDGSVVHHNFSSEEEMIYEYIMWQRTIDPDIITGWNVMLFDIPYLYNRAKNILDEKVANKLSPWDKIISKSLKLMNKENKYYELLGISILDYFVMYKKTILEPRENYKLGYIAELELGETKIDWTEKYDTMRDFYSKDFQWFVEYNIQDVNLTDKFESKLKLIELTLMVAYLAKVNYIDVWAQTRVWDIHIFNQLQQQNIVIPFKEIQEKDDQFEGAFVKEPIPGMYEWVVSVDVKSLYPNIIRVLNIGPETKIKKELGFSADLFLNPNENFGKVFSDCKLRNHTFAANGVRYTRDIQSFYSKMIEKIFNDRMGFQATIKKANKELVEIEKEIENRQNAK